MPTFAQPWNGLGDVYAGMGRSDEALKAYQKAIELNKQYVTPWIRLAVLYTKQERYREAIRAYQQALALDARNSAIWNELGIIQIKSDALDEAAGAFSKAIELDRGCGWAYSNLAYTYTLQGEYKQTISLLLRSIDLLEADKDKAVSWNRLADAYRLLNDYDNAIAAYQMADQLNLGNRAARQSGATIVEHGTVAKAEAEPAPVEAPAPALAEPAPAEEIAHKALPHPQPTAAVTADQQVTKPLRSAASSKTSNAPAWIFEFSS